MEIHTDFRELFLTDAKGVHKNTSGFMPIFTDIVNLLEKIDSKKVDYIVLFLYSAARQSENKLIVLKAGSIKHQLEKQHIRIYEYAGDDYLLPAFQPIHKDVKVEPSFVRNGENIEMLLNTSHKDIIEEDRLELIYYSSKKAYEAAQRGLDFATTMPVQMYIEVYGSYIASWEHITEKERWKVRPIFFRQITLEEFTEHMDAFEQRYFPHSEVRTNELS